MRRYIIYDRRKERAGFGYVYARQKNPTKRPDGRVGRALAWGPRRDKAMQLTFVEAWAAITECPDVANSSQENRLLIEVLAVDEPL